MQIFKKELTPVNYNKAAIKTLHFRRAKNGICFRLHWHDRVELLRMHEGEMYVGYGKNMTRIRAGELTIIPPKTPHTAYTTENIADYDVIMFDIRSFYNETDICKTYLPAIYEGRANFEPIITMPKTLQCFDNIFHLSDDNALEITAEVYRLLSLLFSHHITSIDESASRDDTIMEIINYIEEHFDEPLSTASISEKFNYCSEHLCRKFKSATSLTPMNYLKIYRMEIAQKIIKNENCRIKELAERCGFDDANYFTRCFKEHFGVSPTKYNHSFTK